MTKLLKIAQKTLLNNRRSGYTLPTNNKLYPAQWNWDSAFIALGYSYFNLNFALSEITTLLKGQWKDGMIPHILFHDKNTKYFPNHTVWNCGYKIASSGITQPPIIISILKQIIDNNKINKKQEDKIIEIVKKLKKYLKWFIKFRDPKKNGLISILHPWESGYDNSSIWDEPMSRVKVEKGLKYKRGDIKVVNPDQRPVNKDYDRYVTIKNHLKANKYNPAKLYKISKFNVIDIGFNSIFLRALKDLIILLKKYNINSSDLTKYAKKSEKHVIKLFNKKKNVFYAYDIRNKKKISVPSITNFFILYANINNDLLNKKIIKNLKNFNKGKKYIFSSIRPDHKSFEEKRYWRGPIWINCNWIIYQGLKNKDKLFSNYIKKKTIDLINKKGFYEYYSCKNGKAMGAYNFSWSAALYLDFVLNKN